MERYLFRFRNCFPSKSVCRLFFPKIIHTPLTRQMVGPLEGFLREKQHLPPKYVKTSPLYVIKKIENRIKQGGSEWSQSDTTFSFRP